MKSLNDEIRELLLSEGALAVGFADLSDFEQETRDGFRYGISIAVRLNPEVVANIHKGPSIEYSNEWDRANNLLNQLAETAAGMLKSKGFKALAKTRSVVEINKNTWSSKLPHKSVATRAGLGWIGKCALLVTEEYGSAIRITSVLTDAILETAKPVTESRCGECEDCKNICPADAVYGKNWSINIDRAEIFKADDCQNMLIERGLEFNLIHGTCGLCIWSCPWTQRYLKKINVLN